MNNLNQVGLFKILFFNDSRKVGIGLWFYISTEVFFIMKLIDVQTWMACKVMALTLIGGGTLADRFMDAKKSAGAQSNAQKPV